MCLGFVLGFGVVPYTRSRRSFHAPRSVVPCVGHVPPHTGTRRILQASRLCEGGLALSVRFASSVADLTVCALLGRTWEQREPHEGRRRACREGDWPEERDPHRRKGPPQIRRSMGGRMLARSVGPSVKDGP